MHDEQLVGFLWPNAGCHSRYYRGAVGNLCPVRAVCDRNGCRVAWFGWEFVKRSHWLELAVRSMVRRAHGQLSYRITSTCMEASMNKLLFTLAFTAVLTGLAKAQVPDPRVSDLVQAGKIRIGV